VAEQEELVVVVNRLGDIALDTLTQLTG